MSNRSGRRSSYSDHDTISGRTDDRNLSATTRPAVARGAAGHLWKLPVQKSAPEAAGASIGTVASATVTPALAFGTSAKPARSVCRYDASARRLAVNRSGTERNHSIGLA